MVKNELLLQGLKFCPKKTTTRQKVKVEERNSVCFYTGMSKASLEALAKWWFQGAEDGRSTDLRARDLQLWMASTFVGPTYGVVWAKVTTARSQARPHQARSPNPQ